MSGRVLTPAMVRGRPPPPRSRATASSRTRRVAQPGAKQQVRKLRGMAPRRLPMFPLGTVLLPFAHLPLHIFEPRYRALVKDCLAGDGEFGVVLIERGHEVGGGDVRFGVGTVAHIVQTAELPDGRGLVRAGR